jgi:hypothetical protein
MVPRRNRDADNGRNLVAARSLGSAPCLCGAACKFFGLQHERQSAAGRVSWRLFARSRHPILNQETTHMDLLGGVEDAVGGILGDMTGGGDPMAFMGELLNAIGGGNQNGGSEMGGLIQDVAPLALAFL